MPAWPRLRPHQFPTAPLALPGAARAHRRARDRRPARARVHRLARLDEAVGARPGRPGVRRRGAAAARARHPVAGPQPGRLDRLVRRGRARPSTGFRGLRGRRGRRALDGRLAWCSGWPRSAATRSSGVVLVNPFVASMRKELKLLPVLKHVVPSLRGVVNDIKKPGQDEHGYDRLPLKGLAPGDGMWKVVVPDLGRVTQPVLYFRSERRPRDRRVLRRRPSCTAWPRPTSRSGRSTTATTWPRSTTTPSGSSRSPRRSSRG